MTKSSQMRLVIDRPSAAQETASCAGLYCLVFGQFPEGVLQVQVLDASLGVEQHEDLEWQRYFAASFVP